ncbi:OsmC family protein [candidate division WOR-3 bacterium]|nr:OsmC family protein [candidate division WOR-3 bacterium]
MKATSKWIENVKLKIDDGKGHEIISDQPESYGGGDSAPTPLDLVVMGLAGCINVLFVMLAKKMKLEFQSAETEVEADKPKGAKTIERARTVMRVKSREDREKLQKCLGQAIELCPVGLLFDKAGLKVESSLEILE